MTSTTPPPILPQPSPSQRLHHALLDHLQGEKLYFTVARMTLVIVLLHATDSLYLLITTRCLAVAGLVFPPLLRSRIFWASLVTLLVIYLGPIWFQVDNHKYLLTYWCFAICLACFTSDPLRALAINGRILIGLCFAFAALWKIISPDFANGAFLEYTLLTDHRFETISRIAGLELSHLQENWDRLLELKRVDAPIEQATLHATATVGVIAQAMAIWTILIETLVAVTWLWPRSDRIRQSRHLMLLLFAITTYLIATVEGFALLVLVMALVETEADRPNMRLIYVLLFAAVPLGRLV